MFTLRKLSATRSFSSIDDAKDEISNAIQGKIRNLGYIQPGHGWKGKQELLDSEEDIAEMYTTYGKKTDILLWCHGTTEEDNMAARKENPRKRLHSSDSESGPSAKPRSKRDTCAEKVTEVEELVVKFKEKHGSRYTIEKLNAWAHMIHMDKHESLETPPDLPYFVGRKPRSDPVSPNGKSSTGTVSSTWNVTWQKDQLAERMHGAVKQMAWPFGERCNYPDPIRRVSKENIRRHLWLVTSATHAHHV